LESIGDNLLVFPPRGGRGRPGGGRGGEGAGILKDRSRDDAAECVLTREDEDDVDGGNGGGEEGREERGFKVFRLADLVHFVSLRMREIT